MSALQGTNIASAVRPFDSLDTYATHEAQYGKGGHRTVTTLAERNKIPVGRRELLMIVGVIEDNNFYKLVNNPTTLGTSNSDWEVHISSGNNSDQKIYTILPEVDNSLTLIPNRLFKTPAVSTVNINLVSTTEYGKITWNLAIDSQVPTLSFSDTIYWRYDNDLEFLANSYNVFEFETWDGGVTWYGKINKYSKGTPDDFLTKPEVESMIGGWQILT